MSQPVNPTQIVTRFAPSPTGYLHIGGGRTAQFDRKDRHAEVAHEMLSRGTAYKCFSTKAEIDAFRAAEEAAGRYPIFLSPWRDADPATWPDLPYVIRMKAPRAGETIISDRVQGKVTFRNDQLDDMIVLRSDGVSTYMLAVVVDDHDMGVTHVILGDDHLANAARQTMVYVAMDWPVPVWAHIPLIHGPDGKKLSKRHGALGVEEYQMMGYPAAGMRNYLTRLGWAHGDAEIFTTEEALAMFDLDGIGRAPARLDFKKLEHVCGQHIARTDDAALLHEIEAYLAVTGQPALTQTQHALMLKGMYCLRDRAKTFPELLEKARFALRTRPVAVDPAAAAHLDTVSRGILKTLTLQLQNATWEKPELETILAAAAEGAGIGFGKLAQPLRAAIAGRTATPSVYDMMLVIGREETIARLNEAAG